MAARAEAPGELAVLESFCNTLDLRHYRRHGTDRTPQDGLTNVEQLRSWLIEQDLAGPEAVVTRADLRLAVGLRDALRGALSRQGRDASRDEVRADGLNLVLARLPLRVQVSGLGDLELVATRQGTAGALATLLARAATAQRLGTWERLRICSAQDCQWVFYDRSRSSAGKWCSMAVCGNRDKTRRYRLRVPQ